MEDRLRLGPGPRWALIALGLVGAVTVGWWAFALWPVSGGAVGRLARARIVCFGTDPESGLPDRAGWALLAGQPVLMVSLLMFLWGGPLREGLRTLVRRRGGRVALAAATSVVLVAAGLASWRVSTALGELAAAEAWSALPAEEEAARTTPRLDQPAPPLELVTHRDRKLSIGSLRGRPVLVTFVFGHCSTVCPLVVGDALEAARRSALDPAVLIVTLDPWRDTPARLPSIAERWELPADAWLLGGSVESVERTLDAWEVSRVRDPVSGDIEHPPLTYVVDAEGRLAFVSRGSLASLRILLARLG